MWIDSHCHLDDYIVNNTLDSLINDCKANEVTHLITVGTNINDTKLYQNTCVNNNFISFCAGIHPTEVTDNFNNNFEILQKHVTGAVAIGEIGLDFHHISQDEDERTNYAKRQINAFYKQLLLAKRLNLPVVIHCRDAFDVVIEILKIAEMNFSKVLFHCFSENLNAVKLLIKLNSYVSFSGNITFKNAENIRESFLAFPLNHVLIETDCPFLAPINYRGKKNKPSYIRCTGEFCANLLNIPMEEFSNIVTTNTINFFNLNYFT